jgi:hypothetical protein
MKDGNDCTSLVSFKQLRKAAEVVTEAQLSKDDQSALTKALDQGLVLLDITRSRSHSDAAKTELLLALLEWQRLCDVSANLAATFDKLVEVIAKGGSDMFQKSVAANFDAAEMVGLIDWLIFQVGKQASSWATNLHKDRRVRIPSSKQSISSIESPAVLLDCLRQLNEKTHQNLSPSYFHVVALDDCLKACKWDKEILDSCCKYRGIISTMTKLQHLRNDFEMRRQKHDQEQMFNQIYSGGNYQRNHADAHHHKRKLKVKRDTIVEDSMVLVEGGDDSLLDGVHIEFIDEEGEDAGGLTKEWMLLVTQQLICRVFQWGEEGADRMEICPTASLSEVELMGVVFGLGLRAQIAIDLCLPQEVFRLLLLQTPCCSLEDLEDVRPALASGLRQILEWEERSFEEKLSLNFTWSTPQGVGVPLISNGGAIPVTHSNRHLYVRRMCEYIILEERQEQVQALQRGFDRVCHDTPTLRLFSAAELEGLLCGQEVSLSVGLLRRLCTVDGRDSAHNDDYIDQFWAVIDGTDEPKAMLKLLLHFVTANHRISLVSAKDHVAFQIVLLHGQEFTNRLPTASTCTNTLFLPRYPSKEILQSRLLTALRQGSVGFGLK